MNGVGFEILARTPVPKLPPSYPHEDLGMCKKMHQCGFIR